MKKSIVWISMLCICFMSLQGCLGRDMNSKKPISTLLPAGKDSKSSFPGQPDNKGFINLRVVGKGLQPENAINKGQAIIMAERAAIADGYRQMAEKIKGMYIKAAMKMGNGIVDYDLVRIETQTWLRGIEVEEILQRDNGITEASMRSSIYVRPDSILDRFLYAIQGL